MNFEAPRLDDRSFKDIVAEARARIPHLTQEWSANSPADPGLTLVELFAWMTDIILYRLNRVPEKHFVKFMELLGMRLQEATPARTEVTFWLSTPQPEPFVIPGGMEISTRRSENDTTVVFTTDGKSTVLVPELNHLMTSSRTEEGRGFTEHDALNLEAGFKSVLVFPSDPPQVNDALYLGFEQDLSKHLLGIELEVQTAEGAGVDPLHPPFVWEVQGTGEALEWVEVDRDLDTTMGLNVSGTVRLHLPQMKPSTHDGKLAYWVRLRLASTESGNRYDVSPEVTRLNVSSWGMAVGVTNVSRVSAEIVGRSDGTPGQTFFLNHVPVVTRTQGEQLVIMSDNGHETEWSEVNDFSQSGEFDRHYTINSNTGEIKLGPALPQPDGSIKRYGAIPPKGAILKMSAYRFGGGQSGNVAPDTIVDLRSSLAYVDRISNRFAATGGMDAESLENAMLRVPGYVRSLQRAVTASDYEYLARQADLARGHIGRVFCLQPPLTNRGEVQVLIVPDVPVKQAFISPESLELAEDVREAVQLYLDERRLLATRLEVSAPAYQWVETEVHFKLRRRAKADVVTRAVQQKLYEFINPLTGGVAGEGWPIGRDVLVSDVSAAILAVDDVESVIDVKLYPVRLMNRQFLREEETDSIALPSHGVAVSYQHRAHAH